MSPLLLAGALLIVGGVVAYVLHPLLTGTRAPLTREEDEPSEADARKRVALLALRDVEYDFATGKLDEADYEELREEIGVEALAALEAQEAERDLPEAGAAADAEPGGYPAARSVDELEREIAAYRAALRKAVVCPSCQHLNEPGSRFCALCGTATGVGGGEPGDEPSGAGAAGGDRASGSGSPSV